jgi:predicted metalloprotease with PDZ domain
LQPLEHFERIIDPLARRYHAHLKPLKNGRFFIDHIPNYKDNYIKKAGLKVGDEVISINGTKYGNITDNDRTKMQSSDSLKYKIRRQGKIIEIIVLVNKNEKQGD